MGNMNPFEVCCMCSDENCDIRKTVGMSKQRRAYMKQQPPHSGSYPKSCQHLGSFPVMLSKSTLAMRTNIFS